MLGITTSRQADTVNRLIQLLQEKKQSLINGKPISENDFATMSDLLQSLLFVQGAEEADPAASDGSSHGLRSSLNENDVEPEPRELDKPRCLLVSDGYVLCCFDLNKQSSNKYQSMHDVPLLPKTGILKLLLEERYPVSVGLFKLGCDAYIIGGQDLSLSGYPDPSIVRAHYADSGSASMAPWGTGLYTFLGDKHGMKATSCETYRLSKEADGTLSLSSECNIPAMKKPKVWPIIEKIGGLIHVIETNPLMFDSDIHLERMFTHGVLDTCDRGQGWTEIPTDGLPYDFRDVRSLLVVGDRIYALVPYSVFIFDLKSGKWEGGDLNFPTKDRDIFVEQVWHLLFYGNGRYVGKYLQHGESSEPLYMVIAIMQTGFDNYDGDDVNAVAFLASSTGRVLFVQRLLRFFEEPVKPRCMLGCTVFYADEQEQELGSMMCSVVNAKIWRKFGDVDYLLINTFVVEALADAGAKVREILGNESCTNYPVELEFVRAVVKDRYVYKTDSESEEKGDLSSFPRVQACFL